jgi:hypothetical protein
VYYHGARYYAAWVRRWTRADLIGLEDGVNQYAYVKNHPDALIDNNGRNGIRPEDIVSDTTAPAGNRTLYHVVDWRRQAPEVPGYSAVGNQLAGIEREGFRPATSGAAGQFGTGVYAFANEEQAQGLAGGVRPYAAFRVDPATPVRTITVRLAGGGTNTYTIVAPNVTENLRATSLEFKNVSEQQAATYREAIGGNTPVSVRDGGGPASGRVGQRTPTAPSGGSLRSRIATGVRSAATGARSAVRSATTGVRSAISGAAQALRNNPRAALAGAASTTGGVLARSFIPGAAEVLDTVAAVGVRGTATLAAEAAAPLAVVAAGAAAGYVVGDVVETYVTRETGSRTTGVAVGTGAGVLAGAAAGAAVGAAIGALGFGVGAVPGAAIGAAAGAVAGFIGAYW